MASKRTIHGSEVGAPGDIDVQEILDRMPSEAEILEKSIYDELSNANGDIEFAQESVQRAVADRRRRIQRAIDHGWTYRKIADAMGISHQRVAQIVKEES